MSCSSRDVNLPRGSTLVEDADEEIFLLYTRKQQPRRTPAQGLGRGQGLGISSDASDLVALSFSIEDPWAGSSESETQTRGRRLKAKSRTARRGPVEVELEVHQSIDALRNRAGDTGSVLWRSSLHFARFVLTSHHFPHPSRPSLLPNLSSSSILEFGSGTGFLGIALRSVVDQWTFTDQLENLALILRNARSNSVAVSDPGVVARDGSHHSIVELDWIEQSRAYVASRKDRLDLDVDASSPASSRSDRRHPDVILAVDCIYNPALSVPLAHAILHNAHRDTVVVVVSELRESEALETFLATFLARGREQFKPDQWQLARVDWADETPDDQTYRTRVVGELGDSDFVTWVAWCEPRIDM
ncbi:hypothetical protein JCM3766R1_004172 [Sporobolomyces carnicolor]